MNKIFLVFVSLALNNDLLSYRKNKNYKVVRSMSEFLWYDNIINSLEKKGYRVLIPSKQEFWSVYKKYKNKNVIVLVDHNRSVDVAVFGEKNGCFTPKNIYCMGWWERNPNDKRFKYKFKNGQTFLLENNLTAYKYGRQKFLGFNTSLLFSKITKKKYENYGLIWGKRAGDVYKYWSNYRPIISYLCRNGIKLYTVCEKAIEIDGVINLGPLNKLEYSQLLSDTKFFLGVGDPRFGLAVIEALYYKTPIICQKKQLPPGYDKSPNCYTYESMNVKRNQNMNVLLELLENIKFEENDEIVKRDCSVEEYNKRLEEIFK